MSEQANASFHTSVAGYALITFKEVQGEGVKLSDCSSHEFYSCRYLKYCGPSMEICVGSIQKAQSKGKKKGHTAVKCSII